MANNHENDMVYRRDTQAFYTESGYKVTFGKKGARHFTAPPRTHWDGTASAPQARRPFAHPPTSIATNLAGALSDAAGTRAQSSARTSSGGAVAATTAGAPKGGEEGEGLEAQQVSEDEVCADDTHGEAETGDQEGEEEGEGLCGGAECAEGVHLAPDEPTVEPRVPATTGAHGELVALLMAMLRGALAALQTPQGHGHWHERVEDASKRPLCKYCNMRTGWVCSCPEQTPLCGPGTQCMKSHQLRRPVPKTRDEKEQYMAERKRMMERAGDAHAPAPKKPPKKRYKSTN